MNIFEQVKQQVSLLDVIAYYTEDGLKECGTHTFEMSDKTCPFCGHKDCFKVKFEDEQNCFAKCFSCGFPNGKSGDAISFVEELKQLSALEAARLIAKDFKLKIVERRLSVEEKILTAAAEYYHSRLFDAPAKDFLDKQTPLEYQTKKRHHKVGTLVDFKVGYADGDLCDYLQSINFSAQDIIAAGLGVISNYHAGRLVDYFAENCFVYPQYVDGVCSHISRKDPQKGKEYQLSKRFRRNDIVFYNQDSVKKADKVFIVEGENDLLSLYDFNVDGALLASCGSIGGPHEGWLEKHCQGKQIYTIFDSDQAGDTYREKVAKLFPNAVQVKLPGPEKDIDDYLGNGKLFADIFNHVVKINPPTSPKKRQQQYDIEVGENSMSVPQYDSDIGILERDKSYFKIKHDKDGNEQLMQISDFVITLRSTYVVENKRNREAIFEKADGFKSSPILVDSETKVSMKSFKAKVADACEGSFFGNEIDLQNVWRYIYKKSAQRVVNIPDYVGRLSTKGEEGDWLFENCYIRRDGEVVPPDKNGTMWVNGNTRGIRPKTLSSSLENAIYSDTVKDIPKMTYNMSPEEREQLTKVFCHMYAQNLGNVGKALLMIGWAMMNAYSDKIFPKYTFVPFLFGWGGFDTGKSTLLKWLLALYDMHNHGYSTLPNLRSGVGMERKLAYYASLPVCIDELRAGKDMNEFSGRFRAWYNRSGRAMGASNSYKEVVQQEVRTNFVFGGQDIFTDDALRSRTLAVRISKEGREMKESYRAIHRLYMQGRLNAIGYGWIQEALKEDYDKLFAEIEELEAHILEKVEKVRNSQVWAIVGIFSKRLATRYFPGFDMESYLTQACVEDDLAQLESNFLTKFFETVEGLMYQQFSPLTSEHFKVDGDKLMVWFNDVFRIVNTSKRDATEEIFTKEAIKSALREENYFQEEKVVKMGTKDTSRRAMVFDVSKQGCPTSLKNLAHFTRNNL